MVDIAMCRRKDCPMKNTCFRYLAFPDERQTYLLIEKPILDEECEYYWRCRDKKELQLMNKWNR